MKYEFLELDTRHKLGEGRDYGVGFCLCTRDNNKIVATQAISPCRDYLNDCIYSEHTGQPYNAYGQDSVKTGLFDDGKGYTVFGVCKKGPRNPQEYGNYKKDYNSLDKNHEALQSLVNQIEKNIKVKKLTEIIKLKDNRYLAIHDTFWGRYTYLISLYSFILRAGIHYEKGDAIDYFDNGPYDYGDKYMWPNIKPKLISLMNGNVPVQDLENLHNVHGTGIYTFKFPDNITTNIKDTYKKAIASVPMKHIDKLQKMTF
jgi:hypothetical protein